MRGRADLAEGLGDIGDDHDIAAVRLRGARQRRHAQLEAWSPTCFIARRRELGGVPVAGRDRAQQGDVVAVVAQGYHRSPASTGYNGPAGRRPRPCRDQWRREPCRYPRPAGNRAPRLAGETPSTSASAWPLVPSTGTAVNCRQMLEQSYSARGRSFRLTAGSRTLTAAEPATRSQPRVAIGEPWCENSPTVSTPISMVKLVQSRSKFAAASSSVGNGPGPERRTTRRTRYRAAPGAYWSNRGGPGAGGHSSPGRPRADARSARSGSRALSQV